MSTYVVRGVDRKPEEQNFVAVVDANNVQELFWAIDEFIDPWGCEYKRVSRPGFIMCMAYQVPPDWDAEDCDVAPALSEPELGEDIITMLDGKRWRRMDKHKPEQFYTKLGPAYVSTSNE